jgi:hypothetical protein
MIWINAVAGDGDGLRPLIVVRALELALSRECRAMSYIAR